MKNAIKSIIRRLQEEVYEIHLYHVSGSSTFKLYRDLKVLMLDLEEHNDYIGFELKQFFSIKYNQPLFIVEYLINEIKRKYEINSK
jgi:hypothetical protein